MQVDSLKHQISREIKDHRDGRDMYQYETRETLKPIVDSQTEGSEAADAKKDWFIKQLQDNQLALTKG